MFDIRLRLYTAQGQKLRVLKTLSIDFTDDSGDSSTLKFTTSERVAGHLVSPYTVALEYSSGGAWVEPRNARFIVKEDSEDTANPAGIVSFTGVNLVGWLLGRNILHWTPSVKNASRHWDNRSAGYILNTFLVEAQGRGWGDYLNWDFTGENDSNGVVWPADDRIDADHRLLTPASQVMSAMVSAGLCEWWTEGLTLRLGVPGTGVDRSAGPGLVRLGPGARSAPVKTSFDGVFTHLTVVPEKARYWLYLANSGASTAFGRLEASQSQDGIESHVTATRLAQPALEQGRASQREASLTFEAARARYLPWAHFGIGDVVQARLKGGWESLRVVEFVVQKKKDGAVTVAVTLQHRFQALQNRIAKRVGNASVGTAVSGAGGIPLPASGQPAMSLPSAPSGLQVDENTGYFGEDGLPKSRVTVSWLPVTETEDGSEVDIDQYELWMEGGLRLTATAGVTAALELEPGLMVAVVVRAHSVTGWSDFSDPLLMTPEAPAPPQSVAPTGLRVVSNVGSFDSIGRARSRVELAWDAVTQGVDGGPITVGAYDVWGAVGGGQPSQMHLTSALTAVFDLTPGVPMVFTARAQAAVGLLALGWWSDHSAPVSVTGANPVPAVFAPTTPTLSTGYGNVSARWDGTYTAASPGAHAVWIEARIGAGPWTQQGIVLTEAGSTLVTLGDVDETVAVRAVSYDRLGRQTGISGVSTIKVASIPGASITAGTITVDQLLPNIGDTLNLGGNAVVINLNSRADQAVIQNTQTQQDLANVQADTDEAAAAAEAANQAVESLAAGRVLTAEASLAVLSGKIDNYENSFLFLPDGLHIRESTTAKAEMVLTSAGARLMADGAVASEWNQGQMIVDQIVANGGRIGNHILDRSIPGHTTYRSIT